MYDTFGAVNRARMIRGRTQEEAILGAAETIASRRTISKDKVVQAIHNQVRFCTRGEQAIAEPCDVCEGELYSLNGAMADTSRADVGEATAMTLTYKKLWIPERRLNGE